MATFHSYFDITSRNSFLSQSDMRVLFVQVLCDNAVKAGDQTLKTGDQKLGNHGKTMGKFSNHPNWWTQLKTWETIHCTGDWWYMNLPLVVGGPLRTRQIRSVDALRWVHQGDPQSSPGWFQYEVTKSWWSVIHWWFGASLVPRNPQYGFVLNIWHL